VKCFGNDFEDSFFLFPLLAESCSSHIHARKETTSVKWKAIRSRICKSPSHLGKRQRPAKMSARFFFFFFWVTGELSTLRQMITVLNEPGLSPNNGLENAFLSDQSMASNPRKGQAKRPGAKTTSHDRKAGHVMTHVCHCVRQEERQV